MNRDERHYPDGDVSNRTQDNEETNRTRSRPHESVEESRLQAMRDQYAPENSAPADERAAWREIARAAAGHGRTVLTLRVRCYVRRSRFCVATVPTIGAVVA